MKKLIDNIQSMVETENEGELWQTIFDVFADYGQEKTVFIYGSQDGLLTQSSFDSSFGAYYVGENLSSVDPFIQHSLKSKSPILTGANFLEYYPTITKQEKDFAQEVSDYGFSSGLCVPLVTAGNSGFGGWNIGGDMNRKEFLNFSSKYQKEIEILAHFAYQSLLKKKDNNIHCFLAENMTV